MYRVKKTYKNDQPDTMCGPLDPNLNKMQKWKKNYKASEI